MTEGNPFDVDGVWLKSAFHTHTGALRRRTRPGGARPASRVDGVRRRRHHRPLDAHARTIDRPHPGDHRRRTRRRPLRRGMDTTARSWRSGSATSPRTPAVIARSGVRSMPTPIRRSRTCRRRPRCIADQGGVSFIAHPYWSGMPLETLMAVEGAHGIELFNSSAQRENARGDSSYVWDLCWTAASGSGRSVPTTVTTRDSTSVTPGPWCGRPSAARRRCSRRCGRGTPTRAPGRRSARSRVDGTELEVRCSPARAVVMASRYETGWSVMAGGRNRMEEARVLERDDRGLIVRARFSPPSSCRIGGSSSRMKRGARRGPTRSERRPRVGARARGRRRRGDAWRGSATGCRWS